MRSAVAAIVGAAVFLAVAVFCAFKFHDFIDRVASVSVAEHARKSLGLEDFGNCDYYRMPNGHVSVMFWPDNRNGRLDFEVTNGKIVAATRDCIPLSEGLFSRFGDREPNELASHDGREK